jgi:hypothetical protein
MEEVTPVSRTHVTDAVWEEFDKMTTPSMNAGPPSLAAAF